VTDTQPAIEPALTAFLQAFLGDWPDRPGLTIVGSEERTRPGWDGSIRRVVGVGGPAQQVISVPEDLVTVVRRSVSS
jgi:hypothetical protein